MMNDASVIIPTPFSLVLFADIIAHCSATISLSQSLLRILISAHLTMADLNDQKHRPVFFFDIDNCLYPHSYGIQDHMQRLIGL